MHGETMKLENHNLY